MLTFLPPQDLSLNTASVEVDPEEILSEEIQGYIDQMYESADTERVDPTKKGLVGLAAPQVGIFKRIILVDMGITEDRKNFGELRAFINPRIISKSKEQQIFREGCFSVDRHISGVVSRAKKITIAAFDRKGKPVSLELEGYTARIFQHEMDHLEGIRFPDRVGEEGELHWVENDEFPNYRLQWRKWGNKCPWNVWLAMKEGKSYV